MKVLEALIFCLGAILATANGTPLGSSQVDAFDTLDDYSLLGILELVSFGDLAVIASLNPRAHQLIWDYSLISNYNAENATLLIEIGGEHRKSESLYRPPGESSFIVLRSTPDQILATLQIFCPIFGRMELKLMLGQTEFTVKVVDYINRYCSTIPQKLTLNRVENPLPKFTAWNVSDVTLMAPELLTNFSIATHFPRIEQLHLRNNDYFTSTEHLPHLKHFDLGERFCGRFNLRAFAEQNPQITSAKLELCEGMDILQEVNELLPNLVSLHYTPIKSFERTLPAVAQAVRFPNVTTYTIDFSTYMHQRTQYDRVSYSTKFSSIGFEQLERLECVVGKFVETVELIAHYTEVKSVEYSSYPMNYENMRHLVESLPNLREITFRMNDNLPDHTRLWLLMEDTNLEAIRVRGKESLAQQYRAFTMPEQWALDVEAAISDDFVMTFSRIKMNSNEFMKL